MNMCKKQYGQQGQTIHLELRVLYWEVVKNNFEAVRKLQCWS